MKTIFLRYKLPVLICLCASVAISCNDWLDVKPKTEMEAGEMFLSEEGFKGALAGVYTAMNQPSLYGRELTFGLVDVVAQQWKIGTNNKYTDAARYEYQSVTTKGYIDRIWNDSYNAIANANSIITHIERTPAVFTGNNKQIIKGEALAIRAYLHFDLLRLFGKDAVSELPEDGIPYVDQLTKRITPSVAPKQVISNIMRDLRAAAESLKEDPILTGSKVTAGEDNGYLLNRNYHLNYYAVIGLMARVELYAGNTADARKNAMTIIHAGKFPWGTGEEIVNPKKELRDRTISGEHLFALNIRKLTNYIDRYFIGTDNPLLTRLSVAALFGTVEDFRKNFFETMNYVGDVPSKLWQMNGAVINGTLVMPKRDRMPMIRLSEMYYIVAECDKANQAEAIDRLNEVLVHRGYTPEELLDAATVNTPELVQEALLQEYRREFICEGQLFYYHKRMKDPKLNGKTVNYVFPKPDVELEFGK